MRRLRLVWACAAVAALLTGCEYPDPLLHAEWDRVPDSEILKRTLRDGPAAERSRAALAMGRIQSAPYAGPLARAARDPDPDVRLAALFALGQLGLAEGAVPPDLAVEACAEASGGAEPATVAAGVECLGKLARADSLRLVIRLAGHRSARVREEVAHALLRFRFVPLWRGESNEPPALPEEGARALADALRDHDVRVRRAAAHALSRYGEPRAAEDLCRLSGDPDPWVRMLAVRGVGRSGPGAPAGRITWGLSDGDARVRAETVAALVALGRADLVGRGARDDASFHVRAVAAGALGASTAEDAADALRRLARDDSPTVRAAALEALARRAANDGDQAEVAELLGEGLEEEAWPVRVAAVRAAAELGEAGAALLDAASTDGDARVGAAAIEGLRKAGRLTPDHPALLAAFESDDLGLSAAAVGALGALRPGDLVARVRALYDRSVAPDRVEIRGAVLDAVEGLPEGRVLVRRVARGDPSASLRRRAAAILRAAGEAPPAPKPPATDRPPFDLVRFRTPPVVVLETERGEIEIELLDRAAPLHVSSFVGLVRRGFYDGLPWHRVVTNFVIQGGDPQGSGWGGPGYTLPDEIHRERFRAGTVGMPKAGRDTGGCQIFITHVPTPHLDGNYTVFGRVVSGLEVVDRIEVGDVIERAYEVGG